MSFKYNFVICTWGFTQENRSNTTLTGKSFHQIMGCISEEYGDGRAALGCLCRKLGDAVGTGRTTPPHM